MKVPRLGVELEYSCQPQPQPQQLEICDLHHSSQQRWILNPLSGARDRTCILMDTSQVHYCWAKMGTPMVVLICIFLMTYDSPSSHMLVCHLYVFFHEVSAPVFCHFKIRLFTFLLLSFNSSFYILVSVEVFDPFLNWIVFVVAVVLRVLDIVLDSSPVSEVSFANISQFGACLLILLTFSITSRSL